MNNSNQTYYVNKITTIILTQTNIDLTLISTKTNGLIFDANVNLN